MKINRYSFSSLLILILFSGFFFTTCSTQDTARVTINLGLNGQASAVKPSGFADRFLNLLTLARSAYAAAPSNITSIVLTVTGSGMADINSTYSAGTSVIDVDIPVGKSRQITVTANIDPADPRAVLAYAGTATVDLKSGESKDIALTMMTAETKIVIPDYQNNRVVQIESLSTGNSSWKTLTASSPITGISFAFPFSPKDIAFDAQGRIYVANHYNYATGSEVLIFRIDSITGGATSAQSLISGSTGIQAIAIDMKNSILYYATTTQVFRTTLDGVGSTPVLTSTAIYGINVDDNGMLYIAYYNGTNYLVSKIDPSIGLSSAVTYNLGSTSHPSDVVVKSGKIYVSVWTSTPTAQIVQLDSNLQFVASYGSYTATADGIPGHFYGPAHFVAILNRKLYIIDDGGTVNSMSSLDKLVSIDDITGSNWAAYGSNGGFSTSTTPGLFHFYAGC
jgi:hypothetical protein